ncbi:site-specific DNA-methyltransferase [Belliella kenyensis]|uniref:site-specific DNA-methyltransferase (adenine-specific) n=1 Tax=Belliella kenyensis TaxID=1472724 RepID=A0ABV8EIP1_9BACT|nr:site-specific DNA-methyltransferase [Belliella kenyensis]MCH7401359.1 site-specific DNA-methyltransferase [Belliella kenyensis]MDN3602802.1 site-specific DNA-methyltransferase [Belliella kenyensis]
MPTLNWIGKDKVVSHHQDVPYRVLEHKYGFTAENGEQTESTYSGNKIIHGDNLEALKSLLPEYEGKIKCIYIDPPYNTGNESWVYNDNVNHPKIKKWLGEVVGKDGEDLTRHDKWLCMMYPRLKLLHKLLADDGVIFISIDDIEYQNLKHILDEIFGAKNFITTFTWRTDGNFDNQAKIKINHEYIICYSKNASTFSFPEVVDPNVDENSKIFKDDIVNTIVKNGSKNPISKITLPIGFPAKFEKGIIKKRNDVFPFFNQDAIVENYKLVVPVEVESGWSSKRIFELFIENGLSSVLDTKGQITDFYLTENGAIENIKRRGIQSHVISSLMNMGNTQNMSNELKLMGLNFDFPKPISLIKYFLSIINDKTCIILDSFAGSGTTAHAVLNLNKQDGGNRKFILVEMEDYANDITAERVKRVSKGFGTGAKAVAGTGGAFDFYELGLPLFDENQNLNEQVGLAKIREYIWFSETRSSIYDFGFQIDDSTNPQSKSINYQYELGVKDGTVYYFIYEKDRLTTLDFDALELIKTKGEQYVIYADNCLLPKDFMAKKNIIFKKIPRDITRF